MTTRSNDLLLAYTELDWETYITLSDSLTAIDMRNIPGELSKQATMFSYYAGLFETAKNGVEKTEIRLTNATAKASISATETLVALKSKITAAILEGYVNADQDVQALTLHLSTVRYKMGLLKSLMQSLAHKKDMLVQISANQRAETGLYNN